MVHNNTLLEMLQTPGLHQEMLHTLLVDVSDQDERISAIVGKVGRRMGARVVNLLGVVEPDSATLTDWAQAHKEHSLLALDNDIDNITDRLIDDSLIVVTHTHEVADVMRLYGRVRNQLAYTALSPYVKERANIRQSGHKGISSSAARMIAKVDYHGDLGGGQPKNPLRVGSK